MAVADAHGLPIALHTEAASPAEVSLVAATMANLHVDEKPVYVVADKAYDSDPLREQMAAQDMILLAPHRTGRTRPPLQRWQATSPPQALEDRKTLCLAAQLPPLGSAI
jgi:IS5 family transposase